MNMTTESVIKTTAKAKGIKTPQKISNNPSATQINEKQIIAVPTRLKVTICLYLNRNDRASHLWRRTQRSITYRKRKLTFDLLWQHMDTYLAIHFLVRRLSEVNKTL